MHFQWPSVILYVQKGRCFISHLWLRVSWRFEDTSHYKSFKCKWLSLSHCLFHVNMYLCCPNYIQYTNWSVFSYHPGGTQKCFRRLAGLQKVIFQFSFSSTKNPEKTYNGFINKEINMQAAQLFSTLIFIRIYFLSSKSRIMCHRRLE